MDRAILDAPEVRIEGRDKVTGSARYVGDLVREGMLHVAYTRSPYPHARFASVDTRRAETMPGVHAILTGADVRPRRLGRRLQDWPLLAWDRVRMVGDRVAAVAAGTLAEAEAAAQAVDVEYQELPAIFDVDASLAPGAPILHPEAADYTFLRATRPTFEHPNIQGHAVHEHGDARAAMATAAHVFEHSFEIARVVAGALEPHASLAWLEGEVVHVQSTNKSPFRLRDQVSAALDIPLDQLVIDSGVIGGDFGGKGSSIDDFVLIPLARRTGRPVRVVTRYADELRATNSRHMARITLRTGLDEEGRIVAHEARIVYDGGAYGAAKGNVAQVPGGWRNTLVGYRIPNARIEAISVYTNNVPGGHARAPGQVQNAFAAESHVDLMARALGIDPVELRRRNAIRDGETDLLGRRWTQSAMPAILDHLADVAAARGSRRPGVGRGIAIGARSLPAAELDATVELSVGRDGIVEVLTGVTDQGGGAHTALQRIVAQALGVPLGRVRVRRGTTAEAPWDHGVGGSRVTPVVGGAALAGARLLRASLEELAPGAAIETQLQQAAERPDGVRVTGSFEHAQGFFSTFGCAVEVDVDRETGHVRLGDCTFIADVGTVVNPVALRGQLLGGFAMGLGQALMEELQIEDGVVTTANLGDYKMPVMADVPPLNVVLLTEFVGDGPFGAKSAGELANVAVAPAIANAIEDAVGVRVTSLPITAEKVLAGLRQAGS
jgi:CO/xanthine dehydrogenase Mo-binding subunit